MKMNNYKSLATVCALACTSSILSAKEFSLKFEDTSTGIDWSGIVDSNTDTLKITEWTASGVNTFFPENISKESPFIFNAVTGVSSNYDIPDNWDGSMKNWGFLSEFNWAEYGYTTKNAQAQGFSFGQYDEHPDKIGYGVKEVYREAQHGSDFVIPARNERVYTDSQTFTNGIYGPNDLKATKTTFAPTTVPEPSSALLLLVGATGALARRKR